MELTTVREIFRDREKYLNKEIQVGGWVRSNRDSKAFGFLVLHDGTFFETLQIVYHDTMANFQELTKINVGAAVIVKGTLVPTPEAKQPFEIQAEEISIEGASTPDYPLEETSQPGVHAYHHPSASENQHFPGRIPRAFPDCIRHPQILPGERFRLCTHSPDHRKRL